MINYILFLLIITFIFIIYVEFNVGGILFRYNSNNIKTFNIMSLLNYLVHPLKSKFLWNVYLLDVNYIFIISFSSFFYYTFNLHQYLSFLK
jgi:hypothetical protein